MASQVWEDGQIRWFHEVPLVYRDPKRKSLGSRILLHTWSIGSWVFFCTSTDIQCVDVIRRSLLFLGNVRTIRHERQSACLDVVRLVFQPSKMDEKGRLVDMTNIFLRRIKTTNLLWLEGLQYLCCFAGAPETTLLVLDPSQSFCATWQSFVQTRQPQSLYQ